ncbi:hypothetical protein CIG2463D_1010 [Campylobacter iguaniorum]|uniref:hypothetical protein n=1 Tax=Campylobacter iguaniorum TaxID=1244531 RepID=UPI00073A3CB8|nr:hypothetical protein [Campylobacter iguaniorum]ALV24583.1 hypothetical protein CIG2463D_1010 [Campylobacter iguaniorum]
MISAGEFREIGFLMCVFGLINAEKDDNEKKNIKVLKAFQGAINRLINTYDKESQQKAKAKAKKFLSVIVNRADKKEDFIIELRYLICFMCMIRFEPNERKMPINDRVSTFWGRWRRKIIDYLYAVSDEVEERHLIHTEEYGYRILGEFK